MIRSFSVTISGRVQGVFFRASAKQKADELGLKGFVRNERDGNVYIEAEGEEDPMDEFLMWCQKGPPSAVVQHCDVKEISHSGFVNFQIRRA